jgi:hypothetical protein
MPPVLFGGVRFLIWASVLLDARTGLLPTYWVTFSFGEAGLRWREKKLEVFEGGRGKGGCGFVCFFVKHGVLREIGRAGRSVRYRERDGNGAGTGNGPFFLSFRTDSILLLLLLLLPLTFLFVSTATF